MLHEVLVALVGCPGYLIRARPDGYELAPGVAETFLHPAEASLVAQICALGHHFRALEDFVARVKGDLLLHFSVRFPHSAQLTPMRGRTQLCVE